ncbi:hypothetical protein D8M04_18810 [Oceanobacillus piezotolerans]|uniref:Cell division protein n=1 Tax=Oceanobacillus piezotolerans TaxID=2448030 RepID=A0A498DDB5_9BACI|nr:hypothetical protein [Oceanobacillus piezotolerans]RLL40599.1 hypothetical protein D8M04_18810 [Oceanobacillus piezotolerans]
MKYFNSYFVMVPAIIIGTIAMVSFGVSPAIWVQNILIWIIGTVVGSIYLKRKKENVDRGNLALSIVLIALLVLPFGFAGIDGVHRWVTLGPISIYIASIILPFILIQYWTLVLNNRKQYAIGLTFLILIILLLQPDAGQLTAFACAAFIMMWKTIRHWTMKALSFIFMTALVIVSWVFLDDLAPVPYVEEIIFLVADLGNVWLLLGILSLVLLIIPFFSYGKMNPISLSLGVYFLLTMVVTFLGDFPMPIMGYGISPIIGYFIAITWLKKNSETI